MNASQTDKLPGVLAVVAVGVDSLNRQQWRQALHKAVKAGKILSKETGRPCYLVRDDKGGGRLLLMDETALKIWEAAGADPQNILVSGPIAYL